MNYGQFNDWTADRNVELKCGGVDVWIDRDQRERRNQKEDANCCCSLELLIIVISSTLSLTMLGKSVPRSYNP